MLDSSPELEKIVLWKIKKIFKIFIFSFILLIILSILFLLPITEVVITLAPEPIIENFEIKISLGTDKILYKLGIIPGKLIEKKKIKDKYIYLKDLSLDDKVLVFKKKDVEKFIEFKIQEILKNRKVVDPKNNFITYQVKKFDKNNLSAIVNISVKETVVYNYSANYIREKISGLKTMEEIKEKLLELPGVSKVEIKYRWWKKISPRSIDKIRIRFIIGKKVT